MSQKQLTELDYSGHTIEKPPSNRVKEAPLDLKEIKTSNKGDVLWIDGTKVVACGRAYGILKRPLIVVTETGETRELVWGDVPRHPNASGVAWLSNIKEKDKTEISKEDLICEYSRVYKIAEQDHKTLHEYVPDVNSNNCNICDADTRGRLLHTERQGKTLIEISRCVNTDCTRNVYRYRRQYADDTQYELITRRDEKYTEDSTYNIITISGTYHCMEQDDFKFPVETHDGVDGGFYTAEEIAHGRNYRMFGSEIEPLTNGEQFTPEDALNTLSFTQTEHKITETTEKEIEKYGNLCEYIFANRYPSVSVPDQLITVLNKINKAKAFIKTMMFLSQTEFEDYNWKGNKTHLPIQFKEATTIIADYLASKYNLNIDTPNQNPTQAVEKRLESIFSKSLTGRSVIQSHTFTLLAGESDHPPKDRIIVKNYNQNHFDSRPKKIAWKDKPRADKKSKMKFTEITPTKETPFDISYKWQMDEFDMTKFFR